MTQIIGRLNMGVKLEIPRKPKMSWLREMIAKSEEMIGIDC